MQHPLSWLSLLLPDSNLDDLEMIPNSMAEETSYALSDFLKSGSHIYVVPVWMLEGASFKALSEIELESVVLPNDSFYLDLSEVLSLKTPKLGLNVEGVYFSQSRPVHGSSEGSITVTIVSAHSGNLDDPEECYSCIFEYHANERGFIDASQSTTLQEHLDRRYVNPWEAKGKFNFDRMGQKHGDLGVSYEDCVRDWKPEEDDQEWKEISDSVLSLAFNFATWFHQIGRRTNTVLVHAPEIPAKYL